jgi:hypothetical protein
MPRVRASERERKMTARRDKGGDIVFSCSREGCGAELRVQASSFASAWPVAKSKGWVTAKVGHVWLHWCDWVHRPKRNENIPTAAIARADAAQRPVDIRGATEDLKRLDR